MIGSLVRRFLLTTLVALIACQALTGCTGSSRSDLFKSKEVIAPRNGQSLNPEAWEKFAAVDPKQNLASSQTLVWPLPFTFAVHDFSVAKDRNSARNMNVAWNDLLTPVLLTTLPVRFAYSEYTYDKGVAEPVSKTGFHWWLLWASSSQKGLPTSRQFRAKGIPLFYAFVSAHDEKAHLNLSLNHTLWTLGPAWLRMDVKDAVQEQRGYFFAPLLLGGALGGILWSDHHVVTGSNNQTSLGHGPLLGFGGYWKQHAPWIVYPKPTAENEKPTPEIKGRQTMSGVLLGILWSQYERRDAAGKIDKSRYGPLWTMFGYSHRDGVPAVKFLWIPIRF